MNGIVLVNSLCVSTEARWHTHTAVHVLSRIDAYGYAKGDEALLYLAQCLNERADPTCDFVGHIGGDDFMLVLGSTDWRERLDRLFVEFRKRCRPIYRSEDLARGYFVSQSRQGVSEHFELLSLSIGVVLTDASADGLDAAQLAALASEAKRHAKRIPGDSQHVIEAQSPSRAACAS
ncbi:diguanylate cyclase [Stutzerimonas urumqiensis]